jgi:hypothetical protein
MLSEQYENFEGDKSFMMEAFMQLLGLIRDLTEDMNNKVEAFEQQFLEIGKKFKREQKDAVKYKR